MPSDAPDMVVLALRIQIVVAKGEVVDILDFEADVIQAGFRSRRTQQHVMVDIVVAPIDPRESRQDFRLVVRRVEIVGMHETEIFLEPAYGLLLNRRRHHGVTNALDARGALEKTLFM